MKLFKWNTDDLKPKFSNIVENFFGRNIKNNLKKNEQISTVPSVNIADENKAFEIEIAVPSLDKKDIKVEIKNKCLVISSEKQYSNEEKNKQWIRKEYAYASFQRVFQLPEEVDENLIHAKLSNGILNITIEKNKAYLKQRKQIQIH